MKRLIIFVVSVVLILTMFSGCATILSGRTDKVLFMSAPSGSKILINGQDIGTTDNEIVIKRTSEEKRMVTLIKDGYEPVSFEYERKIAGAYWLGLFGLGIPMWIDLGTGACFKAKHLKYEKILTPKK